MTEMIGGPYGLAHILVAWLIWSERSLRIFEPIVYPFSFCGVECFFLLAALWDHTAGAFRGVSS